MIQTPLWCRRTPPVGTELSGDGIERPETFDLVATVLKRTEKAVRIALPDGRVLWLPKSQLFDETNIGNGYTELTVTLWWGRKSDLNDLM